MLMPQSQNNGLFDRLRNGKRNWTWPIRILGVAGFLFTIFLIMLYHPQIQRAPIPYTINREQAALRPSKPLKPLAYNHALEGHIEHLREIERWQPPAGMKVVGLVFYGRRRFVSVLNCYLQVRVGPRSGRVRSLTRIATEESSC